MKKTLFVLIVIFIIIGIFTFFQVENNRAKNEEKKIYQSHIDKAENGNEEVMLINNAVYLSGNLEIKDNYEPADYLNVYTTEPIVLNKVFWESAIDSLIEKGWGEYEYTIWDEGSYTIRKTNVPSGALSDADHMALADAFMDDCGLATLLEDLNIKTEIDADNADGVTYCYLMSEGQRTGSYIRMNFEGQAIGECQAFLFNSEYLEQLETLPLQVALKSAFYIEENLQSDQNSYNIRNIEIKYVEGLPYYSFIAYGIDTRSAKIGYALAVEIEKSTNKDILAKSYADFSI